MDKKCIIETAGDLTVEEITRNEGDLVILRRWRQAGAYFG